LPDYACGGTEEDGEDEGADGDDCTIGGVMAGEVDGRKAWMQYARVGRDKNGEDMGEAECEGWKG
jgi:hypothetical protein